MRLSALMSVYREESASALRQCLESLAWQTCPASEIVLVEDGPLGDELRAVIAGFMGSLPIAPVRLPANVGLGAALRAGLEHCRGELVARMDSDDVCVPERFQKQLEFLDAHPEVDVLGGAIAEFEDDWRAPYAVRRLPPGGPELMRFAKLRTPLNHVTAMFRKASVLAAGSYESCPGFEDYHLWSRMLMLGYRLHNSAETMAYVRCGAGMQGRRGGLRYLRQEVKTQLLLRRIGLLDGYECVRNILTRGPVRLAPLWARTHFYRAFLRHRPGSQPGWKALPPCGAAERAALATASQAAAAPPGPPLVSIVTPVYNAARWLTETLAAVRAQTLQSWEHILVDDGSSDGSLAIAEAAAALDSRIRVLRTGRNAGPPEARNLALDAAKGRFIAFLDADDLWHPEKLARSVAWMIARDYGFIYHDYRHIAHDGSREGALITGPEELNLRTLHTRRGTGGCLTVVIDRQRITGFRFPHLERPYRAEDFCLWLSIIQRGHTGHRLPLDLGRYRLSPKSRSANKLGGAVNAWRIYRNFSRLSLTHAAYWWIQYAWNDFWLYRYARPR